MCSSTVSPGTTESTTGSSGTATAPPSIAVRAVTPSKSPTRTEPWVTGRRPSATSHSSF